MSAAENALTDILEKAAELQAQYESCCAQLNGTEVRLKALLRSRHELLLNPVEGTPPFSNDLIELSQRVRIDLSKIQKERIAIEERIRHVLAERRKVQSELLSLDARNNERASRLEELNRKVEREFANDPHREELQRHLEDLHHRKATASYSVVVQPRRPDPPPKSSVKRKPPVLARLLGAVGLGDEASRQPLRITPLPESTPAPPAERGVGEFDKLIQRVVAEIQELKASLQEREGVSAVEEQCRSLLEKRSALLEKKRANRIQCQRLFEEWRMVEVLQGQDRHQALLGLRHEVESEVSSKLGTAAPRGAADQLKERLGELAEVIEASRLELERLVRNCDKTLIGLQRMMELETRFWSSEGEPAPSEADFELLLGDLTLEQRSPTRPAGPTLKTEKTGAPAPPRFEQKKLWKET